MKIGADKFSIVNKGVLVDGNVSVKGKIVVSGILKGTLAAKTVIISEDGAVNAKIHAAHITIAGKFKGEIKATSELIILQTGICSGNVLCKNLIVKSGGVLNANVTYLSDIESESSPSTAVASSSHKKLAHKGK